MIGIGTNALASSIVLVCRPRAADAPTATRREFVTALKAELPAALAHLQRGNIAPVDLAQAAIGPGMAVYTRYAKVLDAEGKPLSVREALALINQTLDEALAEQEGDFDADSRWALRGSSSRASPRASTAWPRQLSKAKNTSVAGMVEAGILDSKRGKVRLLKPEELPADWDPATDPRLTAWEIVHHLIRVLGSGGEGAAAELVAKLGSQGRDRPRAGLPPLHPLRAQEARGRGARLQRPRAELARDHPPRPRGRQAASRRRPRLFERRGVSHGHHQPRTRRQGAGAAQARARARSSSASSRVRTRTSAAAEAHALSWRRSRLVGKKPIAEWDVAALLKLMWEAWNDVFRQTLGRAERSLVSELRDLPQQVGAPGAVLQRRRRPRARLDGAAADRRLGAAGRRDRAR